MKPTNLAPYTMALLWTCTQCGFVKEGGQPHMECPSCESYKTAFVNLPQHLENEIRAGLKKNQSFNSTAAREQRLALVEAHGVRQRFQVKGRFLP
jgi:rubredoxin